MKFGLLMSAGFAAVAAMTSAASADVTIGLGSHSWAAGGSTTVSFELMGNMTGFNINVDWVHPGGTADTWGSDLGLGIQAPNGQNLFWGGYDVVWPGATFMASLNLGQTASGHYMDKHFIAPPFALSGTGTWTITIGNAYSAAAPGGQWNNITLLLKGVDVPAPGALALLGMAGLVSRRRRA